MSLPPHSFKAIRAEATKMFKKHVVDETAAKFSEYGFKFVETSDTVDAKYYSTGFSNVEVEGIPMLLGTSMYSQYFKFDMYQMLSVNIALFKQLNKIGKDKIFMNGVDVEDGHIDSLNFIFESPQIFIRFYEKFNLPLYTQKLDKSHDIGVFENAAQKQLTSETLVSNIFKNTNNAATDIIVNTIIDGFKEQNIKCVLRRTVPDTNRAFDRTKYCFFNR